MKTVTRRILLIRLGFFVLQLITNYFLPPYDTSAAEVGSSRVVNLGYGNWDAIYYNYLSENDYNYERFGAFFPFYPMILRYLTETMYPLLGHFGDFNTCIVISSAILNNVLFVVNAHLVITLSKLVMNTDETSNQAALLYAINPASVFFTVGYSESLFSFFVLLGLIIREKDSMWYFVFFCLATAVRSNGLTLAGFILYDHLTFMIKSRQVLLVNVICMAIQLTFTALPFFLFQSHIASLYCSEDIKRKYIIYNYKHIL